MKTSLSQSIPKAHFLFAIFIAFSTIHPCEATPLTDEAARLFEQSKHSVFQIRVIDIATDEKSATGSGFYISPEGHMVTNYHVVSNYVFYPDRNQIKFIKPDGSLADLKLLYIDVVHDLAILLDDQKTDTFLQLGNSQINKGERIFSMGNPHDLGMSIVEGTFNGLMEKSMYRKILFSGSLNPGMSGGPALNHNGEVIGINVSTMGNDVSFLVPVEFLKDLTKKITPETLAGEPHWDTLIEQQLLDHQEQFIKDLISSDWKKLPIGQALVPGEVAPAIKCWGNTFDKEKELMLKTKTSCSSEDSVYLNEDVYTAVYSHWFMLHKSKKLNTFRLYNHMEDDFKSSFPFYNKDDEMFTKYNCHTDFLDANGKSLKVAFCVRNYKRFKQLYDMTLILTTTDAFHNGLMGNFNASGVSKNNALKLMEKFIKEINWQK